MSAQSGGLSATSGSVRGRAWCSRGKVCGGVCGGCCDRPMPISPRGAGKDSGRASLSKGRTREGRGLGERRGRCREAAASRRFAFMLVLWTAGARRSSSAWPGDTLRLQAMHVSASSGVACAAGPEHLSTRYCWARLVVTIHGLTPFRASISSSISLLRRRWRSASLAPSSSFATLPATSSLASPRLSLSSMYSCRRWTCSVSLLSSSSFLRRSSTSAWSALLDMSTEQVS
mmetsp:Transcript_19429/g.62276  ORF Transcript_19429/g.62276 Transcript_19429/m.62276 type:complete len:231 (-) Transcript_19429:679-1371(-)